jgi:uroporphyrinogen-III decarboxylase
MDPDKVYLLMAIKPEIARELLEKMFETFCRLVDYYDNRYGRKAESLGLANDNSCFISNKMYCEQVLPFDQALYEKYGRKYRYLHTDGPSDHNFKTFADDLKLTFMDIGGWSSIDAAVQAMKGKVVIHGGLNCKDVYGPLTEETKKKINHALKVAGPGGGYEFAIGGETYVGVPPQTLIDLVAYVRNAGTYPVRIA